MQKVLEENRKIVQTPQKFHILVLAATRSLMKDAQQMAKIPCFALQVKI